MKYCCNIIYFMSLVFFLNAYAECEISNLIYSKTAMGEANLVENTTQIMGEAELRRNAEKLLKNEGTVWNKVLYEQVKSYLSVLETGDEYEFDNINHFLLGLMNAKLYEEAYQSSLFFFGKDYENALLILSSFCNSDQIMQIKVCIENSNPEIDFSILQDKKERNIFHYMFSNDHMPVSVFKYILDKFSEILFMRDRTNVAPFENAKIFSNGGFESLMMCLKDKDAQGDLVTSFIACVAEGVANYDTRRLTPSIVHLAASHASFVQFKTLIEFLDSENSTLTENLLNYQCVDESRILLPAPLVLAECREGNEDAKKIEQFIEARLKKRASQKEKAPLGKSEVLGT